MSVRALSLATFFLVAMTLAVSGCGGGGSGSTQSGSGTAAPASSGAASPSSTANPIVPPLEGPPRGAAPQDRTNFREAPDWQLPRPEDLPKPGAGLTGQEYSPPAQPHCPDGWQAVSRPADGFQICHPADWPVGVQGYVSSPAEDRWFSLGIFRFDAAQRQAAHVSVYVVPAFARPFTYTRDCQQAYQVTFAGQPAALCPDYPGQPPEAQIIAYHVRLNDLDYFINAVSYFQFDEAAGAYSTKIATDGRAMAIQIAQTFQFIPIALP